jgi:hemin uptake protein HemP
MFDAQPSPMSRTTSADDARISPAPKQTTSSALFGGAQELRIDHHGQEYRLRQTRNGKLILTK